MSRVDILVGSVRKGGNTELLAGAFAEGARLHNEVEIVSVADYRIHPCTGCNRCFSNEDHVCVQNDDMALIYEKLRNADTLVVASPVYYASANATLIACLDRLFYSTSFDKTMKVGASIVVARRGGCTAAFDELNKYFTISRMPVVSSQYWNCVHGRAPGEAACDAEGMQTMRTLARNMAFLLKSIALGKEKFGLPEIEPWQGTHFVREDLNG